LIHERYECIHNKNGKHNIDRVAVDYRNEKGESLITLTSSSETIQKYKDGSISREAMLQELEGQVNFVEIAKILAEEVR